MRASAHQPRSPCTQTPVQVRCSARLWCSGAGQCKHKHDPEINVFNLDEGGDQRGPHSLAGQLSIDQELQMHSLDSDTEL